MRKIILFLSIVCIFSLSACGNQTNEQEEPQTNQEETNDDENNVQENEPASEIDNEDDGNDEADEADEETAADEIEPEYRINEIWSVVPINDTTNEEVVLLTIDDAPDDYALEMAQTLKDLEAPAIFFVNGHFLETEEEKETLREIYDMGFMIGNHTYSHYNLSELKEEEQKEEIVRVNDMVKEITGERPKFFRAPFGVNTDYSKQIAAEEGLTLMNWSYGYDWDNEYMTEEAIADIMVNAEELNNGANLLMHDRKWTNAALHEIVTGLQEKGYEMVDPALIETAE